MPSMRIIGAGRAGRSFGTALQRVGWDLAGYLERLDDPADALADVDLVLIATPDHEIAPVAEAIRPVAGGPRAGVVAHLAGSLGLEVLAPHVRRAAIHPLVSLPNAEIGADRLLAHSWFAVAGDRLAFDVIRDLGGRWFEVADDQRAAYHAASVIASNHLVALLGQVERVAADVGVPLEAYLELVRGTLDNVASLGPAAALTGPAARGDWATIDRHLAALEPGERESYAALVRLARRLVDAGEHPYDGSVGDGSTGLGPPGAGPPDGAGGVDR